MARKVVKPRSDMEEQVMKHNVAYYDEVSIEWSECEVDTYWNEEGELEIS